MILEVCTPNFQSALNAQKAGAQRIELCSELAVGGITPSYGLMEQVSQQLELAVMVLIRPRSGDFIYSHEDFEIIKKDIKVCKKLGFQGVVSGVLNPNLTVDVQRTKELVELARPLEFTFHRAFDHVVHPQVAVEQLAGIGIQRILTSGQMPTAILGIENLKEYQRIASNRLVILPGGGIKASNCMIFKKAGFQEIHASATTIIKSSFDDLVPMNSPKFIEENTQVISSTENIKNILNEV